MDYRKDFFHKILYERPYFGTNPVAIYNAAKNSKYLIQRFRCLHSLNAHSGCVNTISWNSTGRYILSGSDDQHLSITDAFSGEIKTKIRTGHTTNIFSAKYLPNTSDMKVVSCSGDGVIIYTDLNRPETAHSNIFSCQEESVYDIVTVPNDPNTFLTCSHDHTVRWYDLRVKQSCQRHSRIRGIRSNRCKDDVLIDCDYPVTAIAVNQLLPWQLAIGCSDSIIRIHDRRMLTTKSLGGTLSSSEQDNSIVAKFTYDGLKDSNRITSLAYSRNCQQLLASYSNDFLYLFNLNEVHNTINYGTEADVIVEKPHRTPPPYKRFRLRGDWSDTGPSALTNEEIRNIDSSMRSERNNNSNNNNNNNNNNQNSSSSSSSSTSSGQPARHRNGLTVGASISRANSSSSPSSRSDNRIRNLNSILSLLFRNTFHRGPNLQNDGSDSTSTSVQANNSSSSSSTTTAATAPVASASSSQQTSTPRERNSNSNSNRSTNNNRQSNDNRSNDNIDYNSDDNSYDNLLGFLIQFIDDEYAFNPSLDIVDGDGDDPMIGDDDDDDSDSDSDADYDIFDSESTNDSVFNNDSLINTINSSAGSATQQPEQQETERSKSSSSNESRQSRRKTQQQEQKNSIQEKRLRTYKIKNFKKFAGHRNSRTVIKEATFWGDDFIISGSDCGHIFFWSIETGEVVMILEGDQHVVNCLQPHPTDPILASSGIDYDVKIWGPDAQDSLFNSEKAQKIMCRNKHLLEESRDTVTVPAHFVLSLFSSMQRQRMQNNSARTPAGTDEPPQSSRNNDSSGSSNGSPETEDMDASL